MAESDQSRIQKVLLDTDLGDRKQPELLSKMQPLTGSCYSRRLSLSLSF